MSEFERYNHVVSFIESVGLRCIAHYEHGSDVTGYLYGRLDSVQMLYAVPDTESEVFDIIMDGVEDKLASDYSSYRRYEAKPCNDKLTETVKALQALVAKFASDITDVVKGLSND